MVYSGSVEACLPYFYDLGYGIPPFVNPAEYLIDISAMDTRTDELESESAARVNGLKQSWAAYQVSEKYPDAPPPTLCLAKSGKKTPGPTVIYQVLSLAARDLKVCYRDSMGIAASFMEAVSLGVIAGWIFLKMDGSLAGIRSREGAQYAASSLQGYLILLFDMYRLTVVIELFDRERSEGVVNVSSFLISRRLARAFVEDIPVPLIFSLIFYSWLVLDHSPVNSSPFLQSCY